MKEILVHMRPEVNACIYLKDPESSDLGRRIITGSIEMIDEIGFERFTFRKLAKSIRSTEASIYRYFESKHKLLLYITAWYWGWMEYRLVFSLANIDSPRKRLTRAIEVLTEQVTEDRSFRHINEAKLNHIVIAESSKAYLNKSVDQENQAGVFTGYKKLVERVSKIILEINPKYQYPHMLVSTVIEGAHYQRYFAEHLPKLTDVVKGKDVIPRFYQELVFRSIDT